MDGSIVAPAGSSAELVGDQIVWTIDRLGDEPVTLDYQVLVGGLDGVTLRNHATGDGAEECLKGDPDCTTVNYTPHYVLDKAVEYDDPDGDGMAMPGQTLTYTLSLTNDTAHADVTDVVVHDDLTDVLDDADLAMTAEQLAAAGLELNTDDPAHPYLVWTVAGPVAPGAEVETTYTVTIHDDAWDATLHNVATPADEVGSCVAKGECETTTETPAVTTLVIKKVDFEDSSEDPVGLPGATFALYQDNAPYADPSDPVKGAEDTLVSEQVTGADGLAKWAELLKGHYLVHETVPPVNYDLPEQTWMVVVIDESNFVNGGEMAPILFRDFAQGQLTLTKRQWELEGTTWVESDGEVNFGDVVKYTMHLETTGPKRFHDVVMTDWVPDNNPADVTSTGTASLVPDSAVCLDEFETVCSVTVGADGLITWDIGDLQTDSVDLEFVVQFPDLPDEVTLRRERRVPGRPVEPGVRRVARGRRRGAGHVRDLRLPGPVGHLERGRRRGRGEQAG